MKMNNWVSLYRASLLSGVSRRRLYREVANGRLTALTIAGRTCLRVDELEALAARELASELQAVG